MELKVGDKVRVYQLGRGQWNGDQTKIEAVIDNTETATIIDVMGNSVLCRLYSGHITIVHAKQCRRLKAAEKSVRVTKKKFAEAWDKYLSSNESTGFCKSDFSLAFGFLCEDLGLE